MKNTILVVIIILCSIAMHAQRPMNGNYLWNGVMTFADSTKFKDTIFIDSTVVNVTSGFYLKLDSAGVSQTGLYHIIADTVPVNGGTVKGVGKANRIPYWTNPDSLSYSDNISLNPTTTELEISAGTSTTPFIVSGANADTVSLLNLNVTQDASDVVIQGLASKGMDIIGSGGSIISSAISPGGITLNEDLIYTSVKVSATATLGGTAATVDTENKRLGISTDTPLNPLHIDALSDPFLRVENAATVAAGAGTLPTTIPGGFTGVAYIRVNINGADGLLMVLIP